MSNQQDIDDFEAYKEMLAYFNSFDDYIKARDLTQKEVTNASI